MRTLKLTLQSLIGFAFVWFVIWALSYIACVGTYQSSACKQDLTSQIVFKIIN